MFVSPFKWFGLFAIKRYAYRLKLRSTNAIEELMLSIVPVFNFSIGPLLQELLLSELLKQRLQREQDGTSNGRAVALNWQIYYAIRQEILSGTLTSGSKLPSSRMLAEELSLSRNTVLFAYEQLQAEGYVATSKGSGTYVSRIFPEGMTSDDLLFGVPAKLAEQGMRQQQLSRRGHQLVHEAGASDQQWGAFVAGVPDVSLFPHKVWARIVSRQWRHGPGPELLTYANNGGYMPLRHALAEHLRMVRSANCDSSQIILTTGIHQALDLIARMLADPGDTAWMEDPGYWGTRSVLSCSGITTIPIPVDKEGMAPDAEALQNPPKLIFVTPSHQYPLGTVMSLARRQMLLEYARQRGAWIIEDDYDSEFCFEGHPLASLQGLDKNNRVIYVGTFSKTLFPGMRMGYMIVPKPLAPQFATGLSELYREGQMVQQAALAEFMEKGHYATHIRRMRQQYAQRRETLHAAICRRLGKDWPTSTFEAGLHMMLYLPSGTDDLGISMAARTHNIFARPLSRYYHRGSGPQRGLLLGYACVAEKDIAPAFNKLADVIEPALRHRNIAESAVAPAVPSMAEGAWSGA